MLRLELGLGLGQIKKSRQINQSRHMNESRQINKSREIRLGLGLGLVLGLGLGLGLGQIKKSRQINQNRHMNESRQINKSRDITQIGKFSTRLIISGGHSWELSIGCSFGSENQLSYLHLYDLLTETSLEN